MNEYHVIVCISLLVSLVVIYLIVMRIYPSKSKVEGYDGGDYFVEDVPVDRPVANLPNGYPDIIMNYDYTKMTDPFIEPTRRVPRQDIQPTILKQMIDIPSRGYPDSFSQYGVLVKECGEDACDNKILRLFGRQTYPSSPTYEYYTMVSSGNDQIKIPIRNRRRQELYDGDQVRIEELNAVYRVQLHKFDAPRYYPDII